MKDGTRKYIPSQEDFDELFVNDEKLGKIQAYLNRFNPIRVMKMESMEIRHSSILAWLMTPDETHGLEDRFLKAFLVEALKKEVTVNRIAEGDLKTALVSVERQLRDSNKKIDIFIQDAHNKQVFIIENKYYSAQHGDQLATYRESVEREFGDAVSVKGIFLSLHDEIPEDGKYARIGYHVIPEILEGVVKDMTEGEVKAFILHYLDILEEGVGMSKSQKDMISSARSIFRKHRKLLKFINDYGRTAEFLPAVTAMIGVNPDGGFPWAPGSLVKMGGANFISGKRAYNRFNFIPKSWFDLIKGAKDVMDEVCDFGMGDYGIRCPITATFKVEGDMLCLQATVVPFQNGAMKERDDLKSEIMRVKISCEGVRIEFSGKDTPKWSQFFLDKTFKVGIEDLDNVGEIKRGMLKLLNEAENEFSAITAALEAWLDGLKRSLPSPSLTAIETGGSL